MFLTIQEIRHRLASEGLIICKQKLSEVFKNPFYCGYMAHKFLQGDIVKGNHPALVSEEIFLKVNGELSKNHSGYELKIDKDYAPLLGSIKCPCCGHNLTASISTKMRKRFGRTDIGYYVCGRKGCRFNSSTRKVHEAFEILLNSYALSDKVENLLKIQLAMTFDAMNKENQERVKGIKANLKKKEKELEQAETNYVLCTDAKKQGICEKVIGRLESEIKDLKIELANLDTGMLNLDKFINFAFKMRSNLLELWQLQGLEGKRKLQKLLFSDGFVYDKNSGDIEPKSVNVFFVLNNSYTNPYGDKNKGTNRDFNDSSRRVPGAGLEPAQLQ